MISFEEGDRGTINVGNGKIMYKGIISSVCMRELSRVCPN